MTQWREDKQNLNPPVPSGRRISQTSLNFSQKTAAELSGAAGELCCRSLHRSQISKDL
jgi:hypothetical protein